MARLADVAAQAGVSTALASRILTADPKLKVRDDTRRRVLDAANQLGYVPHSTARALRLNRTGVLGLVVHDLTSPVFIDLLDSARSTAAQQGYLLLLGDADEITQDPAAHRNYFAGGRIDGLIVQSGHADLDASVDEIARMVPTVIVNAPGRPNAPGVRLPEAEAAQLATEHLIGLGHRVIGHLAGRSGTDTAQRREEGFRRALSGSGIRMFPSLIVDAGWDAASGCAATKTLLTKSPRPTAVFANNILVGVGAHRALGEQEVSLIALHDGWIADYLSPPLSTVRMPLAELGRQAVGMLLRRMAGESVTDMLVTDPAPELILRGTTKRR